jgi:hypothetical protein
LKKNIRGERGPHRPAGPLLGTTYGLEWREYNLEPREHFTTYLPITIAFMTPETYSSKLSEIKIQAVWHGHVKHKQ